MEGGLLQLSCSLLRLCPSCLQALLRLSSLPAARLLQTGMSLSKVSPIVATGAAYELWLQVLRNLERNPPGVCMCAL